MQASCRDLHHKNITACDTFSRRPDEAFSLCLSGLPRKEAIILEFRWSGPKKIIGELDPTEATGGPHNEGVGKTVCVGPWLLGPGEKKKEKVERKENVVRNINEGIKDRVPVVVRLVGISELRNPLGASNVNQERGSKLVRAGRSNRVRIGDGKRSEFKTICTQAMPPIPHYGVRSTFNIQTPHEVSFCLFLHFWVSVFVSLLHVENRSFFFPFRFACPVSRVALLQCTYFLFLRHNFI